MPLYCGHCGRENAPQALFCIHCGTAFPPPDVVQRVLNQPAAPAQAARTAAPHRHPTNARRHALVFAGGCLGLVVIGVLVTRATPTAPLKTQPAPRTAAAPRVTLPAGITAKGCLIGTRGHSVVMVYTEDTRNPHVTCRQALGKGDYLYTTTPALAHLSYQCTAVKKDRSETLDIFDGPTDLALPKYPTAGTVGSVLCAVFSGASHGWWTVTAGLHASDSSATGPARTMATPRTTPTPAAVNPSGAYTATIRVVGRVPLSFFRVPAAVAGQPHPYHGGEGGGPMSPSVESYYIATGEAGRPQTYDYGVTPNVPGGEATGRYIVTIYKPGAGAVPQTVSGQHSAGVTDAGVPIPFLPIAHPVSPQERLSGLEFQGHSGHIGCMASASVTYRNVTIEVDIENFGSVAQARTRHCAAEYRWATRVASALYKKATAYSAHPHRTSTVEALFYPTQVPYVTATPVTYGPPATATPTQGPSSPPSVQVSVAPDPVTDNEPATLQAITTAGAQCTVSVVYASGYQARSYSLQTMAVADSTGAVSWTWTPQTKYPGLATGAVTCNHGARTAAGVVTFDVQ